AVDLRPERGAPGRIQSVDGAVARAQPGAEAVAIGIRVRVGAAIVAELVVDLPAPDGRVRAEAARHLGDDALDVPPVDGRAPGGMLAPAVVHAPPARIDHQD